eukprot:8553328-Alexandrium_andersonii.AAC.1
MRRLAFASCPHHSFLLPSVPRGCATSATLLTWPTSCVSWRWLATRSLLGSATSTSSGLGALPPSWARSPPALAATSSVPACAGRSGGS